MTTRRDRTDAGETLLELLVAIGVFLVGGTAILLGFATVATSAGVNRSQADIETYARNAAEYALGTSVAYSSCATPAAYQAKFVTDGAPGSGATAESPTVPVAVRSGFSQTVTKVEYWNGTAGGGAFVGVCPPVDRGLQRITLRVALDQAGAAGDNAQTVMIVKRTA